MKFVFQTSRKQGVVRLIFNYQNAKDSREFNKNIILNIKKKETNEKNKSYDIIKENTESSRLKNAKISSSIDFKEIIERALNLSYINDYKGALSLLNNYDIDDDEYMLLKAELYYKNKNYSKAYENYLRLKKKYFNDVVFNLIDLGIKLKKKDDVLQFTRYLIEKNIDFNEKMYLDIIEFLLKCKEYDFLENFISLYSFKYINSQYPDRYNYLAGNLYESESLYKDYLKALFYYKVVIDNYPFSNYYESSKGRYLFLKRFF